MYSYAGLTATELQLAEKTIVLRVRSNPEPGDVITLSKLEGAISKAHAGGVDGVTIVNLLESRLGWPGFSRNSRYTLRARSRISGGSSRYAA